ncbi:glycine oxidase ThiO [Radiobacillus deserti]|uniref:glycine oxidase n=1 Tax=Radiobacillus deserti TaxID=2594883 RepID=A0A516KDK1_9BACI|nr:glycine oxidase ThiO [Radiobacillus deserti]QDP39481.1 glycine oxidase ThiO [Radiobacillus deserti]
MLNRYDCIIVGGGVNGGSIAYHLAKKGKKVLLLEKDRLARKASGAAAGMLAAQAELEEDGPLFQLAKQSRAMFPILAEEIKDLTGIDIELVQKGMYKISITEEEEYHLKHIVDVQTRAGEQAEWLSQDEVRSREPALSNAVRGAMFIEKDGQVSAPQLSLGFLKAAAALGVEIKEYTEVTSFLFESGKVTGIQTNHGSVESEHVIVAGGAWSEQLLPKSQIPLQTYPVKGECFSVRTHQPLLTGTIFSHGCYLVPKKGGRLLVGATVQPHTFDQTVTVNGISSLLEKAKRLVPNIVHAEWEKAWAGIRPQTVDGLPYLGEHPAYEGLFVATGHYRNGILLAPITGEIITRLVEREPTPVDISAFRMERHTEKII